MSRTERLARYWLCAATIAVIGVAAALCVVTQSPWALFSLVPFACLLIGAEYLNQMPGEPHR